MILWSKISSEIGISIVSWASFVLSKQIILTLWNNSKGPLAPFHINQKIIENTYLKSVGFCSQCCSRPSRLFGLTNWKFVIVGYYQHFSSQQKPLSHWLIKIDYCTASHVSCWNCRWWCYVKTHNNIIRKICHLSHQMKLLRTPHCCWTVQKPEYLIHCRGFREGKKSIKVLSYTVVVRYQAIILDFCLT